MHELLGSLFLLGNSSFLGSEEQHPLFLDNMLDYLTLTPVFPRFQGPLNVGTAVFEIPVKEVDSPVTTTSGEEESRTIKARVFYPTSATSTSFKSKPVWWLQEPQTEALGAFGKFLGASDRMAKAVS